MGLEDSKLHHFLEASLALFSVRWYVSFRECIHFFAPRAQQNCAEFLLVQNINLNLNHQMPRKKPRNKPVGFLGIPNNGTSYPYHSHTTPIRISNAMGIVWEAYHKGVPLEVRGITPEHKIRCLYLVDYNALDVPRKTWGVSSGMTRRDTDPYFFFLGFLATRLDPNGKKFPQQQTFSLQWWWAFRWWNFDPRRFTKKKHITIYKWSCGAPINDVYRCNLYITAEMPSEKWPKHLAA